MEIDLEREKHFLDESFREAELNIKYLQGYYDGQKAMQREWINFERMSDSEKLNWSKKHLLALIN